MKKCASDRVRNFVLAGAAGSGKTSLAELMLFKSGAIPRLGTVDSGTTVSDFRKEVAPAGKLKEIVHKEWVIWPGTVNILDVDLSADGTPFMSALPAISISTLSRVTAVRVLP